MNILSELQDALLITIGQICDNKCIVIFKKVLMLIYKDDICIVKGTRNVNNNVWNIIIPFKFTVPIGIQLKMSK